MSKQEMIDVNKCLEIAKELHKGQIRKLNGEPYINHPIRVASNLKDDFLKCVALLHDIIEDTGITDIELYERGINENIIQVIKVLTRRDKETYFDFIMRISKHREAIKVKLADIKDNLSDLDEGSMKDKYRFAQYILRKKLEEK